MRKSIYVDDIAGGGTKNLVTEVGRKLAEMEKKKRYTFNTDKSNYMIIRTGKEEQEHIEIEVKKGKLKEVDKYKYLGNWIGNKGDAEEQIKEIERRANGMITEIKRMAKDEILGRRNTEARILMYERTVAPTIAYNLECWTKISENLGERLERVQGKIIKGLMEVPTTTPYWGILKELGIWPMKETIRYQRLMLYQNLMESDEERLGRKIIVMQQESGRKDN